VPVLCLFYRQPGTITGREEGRGEKANFDVRLN
jgi:hypothetical protein